VEKASSKYEAAEVVFTEEMPSVSEVDPFRSVFRQQILFDGGNSFYCLSQYIFCAHAFPLSEMVSCWRMRRDVFFLFTIGCGFFYGGVVAGRSRGIIDCWCSAGLGRIVALSGAGEIGEARRYVAAGVCGGDGLQNDGEGDGCVLRYLGGMDAWLCEL
jgi:hypothetical protein